MSNVEGQSVIPAIAYIRPEGEDRATMFELFFDLVYVFAVTQLSHRLLDDLTWRGLGEMLVMLAALYWAWNYTTWMANWFDPDRIAVRLVLVFVMAASLAMAVAIPSGFEGGGLVFAMSYVALQVGRNAFVVAVTPPGPFHENFRQILIWSLLSAPVWIAGGLAERLRWPIWLAALALDLGAPLARYWLPRVGATPMSQWQIRGHHFAERFQLFVIIALGESIVLAGATAVEDELTGPVALALGWSFLISTGLWWLYFDGTSKVVARRLEHSRADEAGTIGRDVYTYLHFPIVAGIVLVAVGFELAIAHPSEGLVEGGPLVTLGGVALFLLGLVACERRGAESVNRPLLIVAVLSLLAVPAVPGLRAWGLLAIVAVVLAVLVGLESRRVDRPSLAWEARS